MASKLISIELAKNGAVLEQNSQVIFTREDENGRRYKIFAFEMYESWRQWGANKNILIDNVGDVEKWRRGLDKGGE